MTVAVKDQIQSHLESLGYEVSLSEEGALIAEHDVYFNMMVHALSVGYVFSCYLPLSDLGKASLAHLYMIVNTLNLRANVCRYYIREDEAFLIEAWHPNLYEQAAFADFMEVFHQDVSQITDSALDLRPHLV